MLKSLSLFLLTCLLCSSGLAKERYQHPGPIRLDRDGQKWAEKTLHKLSPEEKVGQLFIIWVRVQFWNAENPDYLQLRDNIRKYHIGSLAVSVRLDARLLLRNQPRDDAEIP